MNEAWSNQDHANPTLHNQTKLMDLFPYKEGAVPISQDLGHQENEAQDQGSDQSP